MRRSKSGYSNKACAKNNTVKSKGKAKLKANGLESKIAGLKNKSKKLFTGRGAGRARKRWILDEANKLVAKQNNEEAPPSCFPVGAFIPPPDEEDVDALDEEGGDDDMAEE
jgi:hypothetical protein